MNKLGLSFFPAYDWKISETHPEREERLLYTQDQLYEEGIEDLENITFINPKILDINDVLRVHHILPNLISNSHLIAASGAYEVYNAYMENKIDKGFALVRPPGHHAFKVVYGDRGFCIINVGVVALEKIRSKYKNLKVAIIDTDAHHADGTENIYYNDKNTLVISLHQDGRTLYPGSGEIENFGGPSAYGYNINVPLLPNTSDKSILYVIDNLVLPILNEYKPDIIINSAGQDNHYSDPLTNMNFTAQGYAKLNKKLNPDLAILEGGYSIESALPYINLGIILAMSDLDFSNIKEPDYKEIIEEENIYLYTKDLVKTIYNNWKNKEQKQKKLFKDKSEVIEKQNIYYDTSNILEYQSRHFIICDKCSGYEYIDSNSDLNISIFGVSIYEDSCNKCVQAAYSKYEKANSDHTFLIDKIKDKQLYKAK